MKLLRFALWNVGVRLCDHIGRPIDALIVRVPFLNERTGACLILHPGYRWGDIPASWWDRFGWGRE